MSTKATTTLASSITFENVNFWLRRLAFCLLRIMRSSRRSLTTVSHEPHNVELSVLQTQRASHGGFDRQAPLCTTLAQTPVAVYIRPSNLLCQISYRNYILDDTRVGVINYLDERRNKHF
jgi:hypothetical protein